MSKPTYKARMSSKFILASLIATISIESHATPTTDKKLINRIEQRVGSGQVEKISPTKYANLWEVKTKSDVIYADKSGQYLFVGRVIETDTGTNITEERLNEINRVDFKSLPLELAIKFTKGNGKRVIAVFEDPNCGYCKVFRKSLKDVDNITVYTFPLNILSPDSKEKSTNIWCSQDRNKAWDQWMLENKVPEKADASCVGVHDQVLELGQKHRVHATPTIIFADGSRVPGALKAPQLEERLAKFK
ncbi:MAG: DsbC family protein [Burkholderiales bacterium]|nr:DsbC family protein [Burkholderiales bacterium]